MKNKMQETASELANFISARFRSEVDTHTIQGLSYSRYSAPEIKSSQIYALGMSLCKIMLNTDDKKFTDKVKPMYEDALFILKPNGSHIYSDELLLVLRKKASEFELGKDPKPANFCRSLVYLFEAVDNDVLTTRGKHIMQACVKAHWAGGDPEKIKNVILLLFG